MPWIKKQKAKFDRQERQTKREYVSGESHFFMGNRYLLNVVHINSAPRIEIKRKTRIDMYINPEATLRKREKLMDDFYRSELKKRIPALIRNWEKKTGVRIKEFKIRKMKTKWGTCNPEYQRVWFNLELAKKPPRCIEYVLVHEMTHLIEKNHTEAFRFLMESFMQQWDKYREELNDSVLGYSNWDYLREKTDV